MRLPDLDFSDLEHGIEVLAEVLADAEHRRSVGEKIMQAVDCISGTAADEFRQAVYGCVWYGDPIEPVRAAFKDMAVACAGWSAAVVVKQVAREVSAEHGRKGGRPRKEDQAADWMRRYDRMATTHRMLTAQERYEQIAADDLGTDAKWRTVRNAISEYRKRQK